MDTLKIRDDAGAVLLTAEEVESAPMRRFFVVPLWALALSLKNLVEAALRLLTVVPFIALLVTAGVVRGLGRRGPLSILARGLSNLIKYPSRHLGLIFRGAFTRRLLLQTLALSLYAIFFGISSKAAVPYLKTYVPGVSADYFSPSDLNTTLYFFGTVLFIGALTGRKRRSGFVKGRNALRRGESWSKTEGLSEGQVRELNDRFERASAEALESLGFRAVVCGTQMAKEVIGHKGSGDGGVDVLATKGKNAYCVSCKRYAGNIDKKFITEIYGTANSKVFTAAKVFSYLALPPAGKGPSTAVMITTVGATVQGLSFARANGVRVFILTDKNQLIPQD